MPSAEDTTSSTVSHSAGSPDSSPEEFAVEPQQQGKSESGSSAPQPDRQNPIDLDAAPSPEEPPTEPGEEEVTPFRTKPLPKVNAVAHEIRVKATGARAGNVSGERELFTESTTTVLVFEKGGVIRLTAAVTPGQLLFLTNEETLREVVTQVIRKRVHRPTECYVELEFTEPAPGFWGMEFSAATALLPKDAKLLAAAEMVASAETTADELDEAAPPPSAHEIEALKKEVEALRSQLRLLQTPADQEQPTSAAPKAPAANSEPATSGVPPPGAQYEYAPAADLTSHSVPVETAPAPEPRWVPAANQESLQKPSLVFRKALPKRKRSFRARGQFTPGFRTGMLRLAVLSCILAALVVTAWYKHWLPWMHEPVSVSTWAGGVTTKVATPPVLAPVQTQSAEANSENNAHISAKETPPHHPEFAINAPGETATENGPRTSLPEEAEAGPVAREESTSRASLAKPSPAHPLPAKAVNAVTASAASSMLVPPKLVKWERAVASLEDLRDFETGSVLIDAIINTEGNATYPIVLSGPPSLRKPALEALRNYKYEPAMQSGRPVPAHVTIKILFHFE